MVDFRCWDLPRPPVPGKWTGPQLGLVHSVGKAVGWLQVGFEQDKGKLSIEWGIKGQGINNPIRSTLYYQDWYNPAPLGLGPQGRILLAQPSSAARITIFVLHPEARPILHVTTEIADLTLQSD